MKVRAAEEGSYVPFTGCRAVKWDRGKMTLTWWRREGAGQGADGKETNGMPVSEVVMYRGESRGE